MKLKGNPFIKGAYCDCKSFNNINEVAAVMYAAEQLGISIQFVDSPGHNCWIEVNSEEDENKIRKYIEIIEIGNHNYINEIHNEIFMYFQHIYDRNWTYHSECP